MKKRIVGLVGFLVAVSIVACVSLSLSMPGKSHQGPLPPPSAEQKGIAKNLKSHVEMLATTIGERNISQKFDALEKSAIYIEQEFKKLGYDVLSQYLQVGGKKVRNLEVVKKGSTLAKEIVVLGAHYDTAPGTPGANDNGTGVAALLELARLFKDKKTDRTVRFVAFVNEEPPYFQTKQMGSVQYAKRCRRQKDNIVAMLSLETMGYYSEDADSQRYPPGIAELFPDKGNFIAFVGNTKSEPLVKKCVGLFRAAEKFPSEGAALPGSLTGVGWSDHWSFWQEGYQALMVTDTAFFRYLHYHQRSDTPQKVDFKKTARVVSGLKGVVGALATNDTGIK